jgi:hypothetical protein
MIEQHKFVYYYKVRVMKIRSAFGVFPHAALQLRLNYFFRVCLAAKAYKGPESADPGRDE